MPANDVHMKPRYAAGVQKLRQRKSVRLCSGQWSYWSHVIERVERLPTELDISLLAKRKSLHQGEIYDLRTGSVQDADT
jgi:hypothetical protein